MESQNSTREAREPCFPDGDIFVRNTMYRAKNIVVAASSPEILHKNKPFVLLHHIKYRWNKRSLLHDNLEEERCRWYTKGYALSFFADCCSKYLKRELSHCVERALSGRHFYLQMRTNYSAGHLDF